MRDALDRLYKTKLQLLAVLSVVFGIALLLLARMLEISTELSWLADLPLTDIGSALFTTGLLAVAFEYIDRKDGDERANQRLRQVLREEAPAIRDAVLDGIAFSPDGLKNVSSPELLERLTRNSLELQLGSGALAEAVYSDVRHQIIDAPERWHDLDTSISLTPWTDGPATGPGSMFVATVRTTYRTTPGSPTMRFACVSDMAEYRELEADPSIFAWHFEPITGLDGASPEVFELVQFTVNDHERPIRRTKRRGSQVFTTALGDAASTGEDVAITYTYRVLVQRAGHLLYLDIPRPTNGIKISLWYGDSSIRHVSALDFIASGRPARVLRAPKNVPARSIDITFDGWVFAKSGVAFVWVLESEMQATPTAGAPVAEAVSATRQAG